MSIKQVLFLAIALTAFVFIYYECSRKDNYTPSTIHFGGGLHSMPMAGTMADYSGGIHNMPMGGMMADYSRHYGLPYVGSHHAFGTHGSKRYPITTVTTHLCNPDSGICSLSVDGDIHLVDGVGATIIITQNSLGIPTPIIIAGIWSTKDMPIPVLIYNPQTISNFARAFMTKLQETRSTSVIGTINQ